LMQSGGHGVPPEKIHTRIPRTLEHIRTALNMVQQAFILDNSSYENRFKQLVVKDSGQYEFKVDPVPK